MKQDLINRITEYLCNGGLFNPEYMNHAEASKLLMDIRDYLKSIPVTDIPSPIPSVPMTGTWRENKCPVCGLTGANGYVCPNHNCPSRVTC